MEEGSSAEKVLCTAEAYPEANYAWKKDGETVATDNVLFFGDGGAERDMAGEYVCEAANRHGVVQTKTLIDVLCK